MSLLKPFRLLVKIYGREISKKYFYRKKSLKKAPKNFFATGKVVEKIYEQKIIARKVSREMKILENKKEITQRLKLFNF